MILSKLNMILFTCQRDSYEYVLADYLIRNQSIIENVKMVDVLKQTNVSKSTLSRFFKKLGYKSYTDVQYLLTKEKIHDHNFDKRNLDNFIRDKFIGKKRIIVIGDSYSVSPLLIYRQKFFERGIILDVRLSLDSYSQMIDSYQFNSQDLIIAVSLYKSDLDLIAEFFSGYMELKQIIKDQRADYLYVGKIATGTRDLDKCYMIEETNNFSGAIYQLCCLFEGIYNFYS